VICFTYLQQRKEDVKPLNIRKTVIFTSLQLLHIDVVGYIR